MDDVTHLQAIADTIGELPEDEARILARILVEGWDTTFIGAVEEILDEKS